MNEKWLLCALPALGFLLCATKGFAQVGSLQITSPAFGHNQMIPRKYTCQGEDINPPLVIENLPSGTESLVLIVDDPDAPGGTWDHWIIYNIPPTGRIEENSIPGSQSTNSFGKVNYGGPCPPSGMHRYFFKLRALDTQLAFKGMPSKQELEKVMQEHVLARAELIGLYQKTR